MRIPLYIMLSALPLPLTGWSQQPAGEVGPPLPEHLAVHDAPGTTPISDSEETGALSDMLPDRVETLPLPDAMEEPAASGKGPGPGLFPESLWSAPPVVEMESPEAASPAAGEPTEAWKVLTPQEMSLCFGAAAPAPLHDPQGLLPAWQTAELNQLLREVLLRGESGFQLAAVVLSGAQQIPLDFNPEGVLRQWFGRRKALLVVYFLGQPQRTQAFFSPECLEDHRNDDLRQVIEFGSREAGRMALPAAQLQRFCYKTAIRLDRLHRQGDLDSGDGGPVPAAAASSRGWWWALAVGIQAAALLAGGVWWWRRKHGRPGKGAAVLLPDQDLVPRMGGAHAAGTGAVIHFGHSGQRL